MNRQKKILLVLTLALIGSTAVLLARLGNQQRLGPAGVKTASIPDSMRSEILLPQIVLDYTSETVPPDEKTITMLPPDTSIAQRRYRALDNFEIKLGVVLMGTDRTSIHKAQFCLEGQGLAVDRAASSVEHVRMTRPQPYDLPVIKLVVTSPQEVQVGDQKVHPRLLYVYWYVADDAISADATGFERMWLMAKKLLFAGELQRWAYVNCHAFCAPGQEDATFDRMKQFIAASVPEFQLTPKRAPASVAASRP